MILPVRLYRFICVRNKNGELRFVNKKLYIVFLIFVFSISCEKADEYSIIPEIKYKNFYLSPGYEGMTIATGNLVFTFIDGDGDIGNFNSPNEETDADSVNMFISGSFKDGGDFTPFYTNSLNLPYLEGGIYKKSIKGEIKIEIDLTILTPDTLIYTFYIVDRAGHESNTVSTPVLIITELLKQM